jgi:acetoin utilization deacetylase AcuC-like enzyme
MKPWWDFLNLFGWLENELHPGMENMAFVYSPNYNMKLMGHIFPAIKFERIFELIAWDETLSKLEVYYPEKADREQLLLVHTEEYLSDFFGLKQTKATLFSELPLNANMLEAFLYGVGGTILATDLTTKHDFVFNIGGGFHHSFPDHAEGFCYLNDVAVAAKRYLKEHPYKRILLIDLDVHQGNGNSLIFEDDNRVFTFSMHQEDLYPVKQKSDLDVGLKIGCKDSEYLDILKQSLETIERKFRPDLIYYLAGVDPFEHDSLGGLKLTRQGIGNRDYLVKKFAKRMNSKVVVLTAGGYAKNTEDTVNLHLQTAHVFLRKENELF